MAFDIAFGVAGNMTGHLEQAGEAGDFVAVSAPEHAPKGLFPTWVRGADGALGVDPFSASTIALPDLTLPVQTEPEVGLRVELQWAGRELTRVRATGFAAYNDVSLRIPAPKISRKKNWGPRTKGLSGTVLPLADGLVEGCSLDRYRLVSLLVRRGAVHVYGEDSAVLGYSYFHQRLMRWVLDRLRNQAAQGPLEDLGQWLAVAGRPERALVGIGATRYTDFGATTMLQPGDETVVVVYDGEVHTPEQVRVAVGRGDDASLTASVLRQQVVCEVQPYAPTPRSE
ncbi:MAG: DUF5718 family protein [Myxococcota bacterium]